MKIEIVSAFRNLLLIKFLLLPPPVSLNRNSSARDDRMEPRKGSPQKEKNLKKNLKSVPLARRNTPSLSISSKCSIEKSRSAEEFDGERGGSQKIGE